MKKTIVTITGIRPDFIRMSEIFKKLDIHFNHILIHTGQHYDTHLSDVFFSELHIRQPDYILNTGKESSNHYEQLAYLSVQIPKLFREKNICPDLILFLGDSNSASVAVPLKKEGYRIGHIEAGMRSHDKRMLEEINRTVCDHCSDILFVYHNDYKKQLELENIKTNVFVVGNTVVEPLQYFKDRIMMVPKRKDMILMDVHRPENFKYKHRLESILAFGNACSKRYGVPIKLLYFKRLRDAIDTWNLDLGSIEMVPLMSYQNYLDCVYHCKFIISDSGTGQEEPALLNTPVIVPRDFTERPQSYDFNCSKKFDCSAQSYNDLFEWIEDVDAGRIHMNTNWLGNGDTSELIINHLKTFLENRMLSKITGPIVTEPYPHYFQDNFLREDHARDIQQEILNIPDSAWDRYENPFEAKYTLRDKYTFPLKLAELFKELESDAFVSELSEFVGHKLFLDPTRNFWGVHKYKTGDKLDIHVDAGLHPVTKQKKQMTLGIYLSKDWKEEYGCALEIWKGTNAGETNPVITEKVTSIHPMFNRMVLFTCNDYAWHGNPEYADCPDGSYRIFLTISYLSEDYDDTNKRVKAYFVKRPTDPDDPKKDELRILRCDPLRYKEMYRLF